MRSALIAVTAEVIKCWEAVSHRLKLATVGLQQLQHCLIPSFLSKEVQ